MANLLYFIIELPSSARAIDTDKHIPNHDMLVWPPQRQSHSTPYAIYVTIILMRELARSRTRFHHHRVIVVIFDFYFSIFCTQAVCGVRRRLAAVAESAISFRCFLLFNLIAVWSCVTSVKLGSAFDCQSKSTRQSNYEFVHFSCELHIAWHSLWIKWMNRCSAKFLFFVFDLISSFSMEFVGWMRSRVNVWRTKESECVIHPCAALSWKKTNSNGIHTADITIDSNCMFSPLKMKCILSYSTRLSGRIKYYLQ